jgi:glucose-1-phosphate adenylyltransferase
MQVDTTTLGLGTVEAQQKPYIASMGIYVFNRDVLIDLLQKSDATDFGKEIIPASAQDHNVQAYLFNGYWEDIGTIESFYEANLALTKQPQPAFTFYHRDAPIYTRSRYLPPSKLLDCQIQESMISEGCILKKCQVNQSVLGVRTQIESGCTIDRALIMGSDYYQLDGNRKASARLLPVPLGIGRDTKIQRAIVDKNACIGSNVQIINKDRVEEAERESEGFYIRSGIVVILKNAVIPDGTII